MNNFQITFEISFNFWQMADFGFVYDQIKRKIMFNLFNQY